MPLYVLHISARNRFVNRRMDGGGSRCVRSRGKRRSTPRNGGNTEQGAKNAKSNQYTKGRRHGKTRSAFAWTRATQAAVEGRISDHHSARGARAGAVALGPLRPQPEFQQARNRRVEAVGAFFPRRSDQLGWSPMSPTGFPVAGAVRPS